MSTMYAEKGEVNGDIGYGVTVTMEVDDAARIQRGLRRLLQLVDDNCKDTDMQDAIDFDACADLVTALERTVDT